MCPGCRQPIATCTCGQPAVATGDGIVRVARETHGRAGKGVTLVRGLALAPDELARTAKQLKGMCGTGGTVKDGTIEIQGDHRERIAAWLKQQGHAVKLAGG